MNTIPQLLLLGSVAAVGVLHTLAPDHWVPIALVARQRGWSKAETIGAAMKAGTGHAVTTLIIALAVWLAGVVVATRFGNLVDLASSIALIAFGCWFSISAWLELRHSGGYGHSHGHDFPHTHQHDHEFGHDHPDHHHHKTSSRTALILILGSSPMMEVIPAFFAAGKYGFGFISLMSAVMAVSTITTYVLLCAYSTAGLKQVKFGSFERYGEVFSGAFIAMIGMVFWFWPVL